MNSIDFLFIEQISKREEKFTAASGLDYTNIKVKIIFKPEALQNPETAVSSTVETWYIPGSFLKRLLLLDWVRTNTCKSESAFKTMQTRIPSAISEWYFSISPLLSSNPSTFSWFINLEWLKNLVQMCKENQNLSEQVPAESGFWSTTKQLDRIKDSWLSWNRSRNYEKETSLIRIYLSTTFKSWTPCNFIHTSTCGKHKWEFSVTKSSIKVGKIDWACIVMIYVKSQEYFLLANKEMVWLKMGLHFLSGKVIYVWIWGEYRFHQPLYCAETFFFQMQIRLMIFFPV